MGEDIILAGTVRRFMAEEFASLLIETEYSMYFEITWYIETHFAKYADEDLHLWTLKMS